MSGKRTKALRREFRDLSGMDIPRGTVEVYDHKWKDRQIVVGSGATKTVIQITPTKIYKIKTTEPNQYRRLKKAWNRKDIG